MAVSLRQSHREPRRVSILGSTGSVGSSTIDLIVRDRDAYIVEAITANRNVDALVKQALKLQPRFVAIADPMEYSKLKQALQGSGVEVAAGPDAVEEAASRPAEWVMAGIVGAAGLPPTLTAIRRGAIIALANKESLVCAGSLLMKEVSLHGATVIPVDSEHNAIYQIFNSDEKEAVEQIILTASGGPFWGLSKSAMADVSPDQAVAHPNWSMGAKISVDSATMMNKGLELIEAFHLFPISRDRLEVVIHPQSVVHGLVAYIDGTLLAHLGSPDMRTPISYALGWPKRMETPAARLDLATIGQLTFEKPDYDRFPALRLAREVLDSGGSAPTILNAANEVAVHGFLEGKVGFLDIVKISEQALSRVPHALVRELSDVLEIDEEARGVANELIGRKVR